MYQFAFADCGATERQNSVAAMIERPRFLFFISISPVSGNRIVNSVLSRLISEHPFMLIFSQDLGQVPDLPQLEANVHIRHCTRHMLSASRAKYQWPHQLTFH